jgi:cell division protease FtsH
VHKVTIIPRGMALGVTQTLPVEDRYSLTQEQMVAMLRHAMGGRAAEQLVFGHLSTGASNDLQQATRLAHEMVCSYGMSDRIGPVSYSDDSADVFLGRDFVTRKNYSEQKAQEIDEEVSRILRESYDEAHAALLENRAVLDRIADALLERETLEAADLKLLLAGQALPPIPVAAPPAAAPPESATRRRPERAKDIRGDKLPDPEPVAG